MKIRKKRFLSMCEDIVEEARERRAPTACILTNQPVFGGPCSHLLNPSLSSISSLTFAFSKASSSVYREEDRRSNQKKLVTTTQNRKDEEEVGMAQGKERRPTRCTTIIGKQDICIGGRATTLRSSSTSMTTSRSESASPSVVATCTTSKVASYVTVLASVRASYRAARHGGRTTKRCGSEVGGRAVEVERVM